MFSRIESLRGWLRLATFFGGAATLFLCGVSFAQDEEEIEEIVVTGTQIRGANISDALPVSVMQAAEIEALGVDSGDELLEFMAEQGQNFFSESENISGGVNSARGDMGAFNLRNPVPATRWSWSTVGGWSIQPAIRLRRSAGALSR